MGDTTDGHIPPDRGVPGGYPILHQGKILSVKQRPSHFYKQNNLFLFPDRQYLPGLTNPNHQLHPRSLGFRQRHADILRVWGDGAVLHVLDHQEIRAVSVCDNHSVQEDIHGSDKYCAVWAHDHGVADCWYGDSVRRVDL